MTRGATSTDGRWHVGPDETLARLLAGLLEQAGRTRAIVESHDLAEVGQPGARWDGAPPATLERVLFHLLQEYARHLGHLDIVVEIVTGLSRGIKDILAERSVVQPLGRPRAPRAVSRSCPPRTGSRTRRRPRSRSAARCPAAGRPAACGRRRRRRACRWR